MIDEGTVPFWRATLALCLGSFMIFSNVYLTQPLLPTFVQTFHITELEAGWSVTITTLTLGISLLFYGSLSDAFGRKNLMLGSMMGVVVTTFMLSQTQSYSMLLFWRGLQGLCLGGLPAIAIAYMSDEFKHKALILAVGFYISGNTIGGIGGRLIGGFVGEWLGWSQAFLVMTVLSFILLMLFAVLLPASRYFSPKKMSPLAMLVQLGLHLKNPLLLLAYLIGGFNFFIFINQYSFVTFLLAEAPYHLSPSWLGMLFLTYLSGTVGSALSGRIAQRIPQPICMIIGILILMGGSLVTLIPSIWAIIVGFLINAFGFFFAHSTASSWVSHNAQQAKASASSLYLLFYYLGASSGGFYLQPFWQWAGWSGIVVGSIIVLSLTLLAALILYKISIQPVAVAAA